MKSSWCWWYEYGEYSPEDDEALFPAPHSVLDAYRARANVSLSLLALELDISEQMVRRIFHKGAGLDSLARRRFFAHRLSIPPRLLGLDALQFGRIQSEATEGDPWWVQAGYPPFARGKDGYPDPGAVIRRYREGKMKRLPDGRRVSWTQYDLGQVCDPPLSEKSVNKMEKYGIGLDSISRRRAMSFLLGIPPVLLGLSSEQGVPAQTVAPVSIIVPHKLTPDILDGYAQHQQALVLEYFKKHGQNAIGEAEWCITNLRDTLLPLATTNEQHIAVRTLEQRYHRFILDIAREQRHDQLTHYHSTEFVSIAEELQDKEQLVVALLFRASTLRGQKSYDAAQQHIDRALRLTKEAAQEKHPLSPSLVGSVLLQAGLIRTFTAQLESERVAARSLLKQGLSMAERAHSEEDKHLLKLTPGYAHLYTAEALTVRYNPVALQEHIEEATRLTDPMLQRRQLILLVVRVEGEMLSATKTKLLVQDTHYAEATTLAIEALTLAKELNSELNKARIQYIYTQLKSSSYGEEPLVARLGLMLKNWRTKA